MRDQTQPLAAFNPEAARHLALSTYYLRRQDFRRAVHYARLPIHAGEPAALSNLLTTHILTGRYDAAAEIGAMALAGPLHQSLRREVLETILPALYFNGTRQGDCREAYAAARELAAHANLSPEVPRWRGQPLKGRRLLLTLSEGGIGGFGDHIMWARFIPDLTKLDPRIVVQCPPALAGLFSCIPGVVGTCDLEARPLCDFSLSIMELPHALGMSGFPTENPFRVGAAPITDETYRIGITWGASWAAPYMDRACALAEYMPLTEIPSATLYGFQKGAHQRQLYPAPAGMQVTDLAPELKDFRDTAMALMSMDAVVTTDNVVANLACMLGRPAFVLVPKCADWRWGEGGRSAWYPSAKVYQQDDIGEWTAPIARLVEDLKRHRNEHGQRATSGATASARSE